MNLIWLVVEEMMMNFLEIIIEELLLSNFDIAKKY